MSRLINHWFGLLGFVLAASVAWGVSGPDLAIGGEPLVAQLPFEAPPEPEYPEIPKATPAPEVLSDKDRTRLEGMIPLLEGRQEFWAMGEFVHYGHHSVPYLIKALKMPGPRLRYNAIETLSMIKDPSAVPALLEVALDGNEMPRIRNHAIRTATRLDPMQVLPAIRTLVKDPNSSIRKTAVFEARWVRQKDILPVIISVIPDNEQFVAITARDSFWRLTGFIGTPHNWETSTPEQRKEWAKEWWAWWEENQTRFDRPAPKTAPPKAPAGLDVGARDGLLQEGASG